jgi:hypothetical protein
LLEIQGIIRKLENLAAPQPSEHGQLEHARHIPRGQASRPHKSGCLLGLKIFHNLVVLWGFSMVN